VDRQPEVSAEAHRHSMNAIDLALLAVGSANDGDTAAAHAHIARAQQQVRTTARRDRQLVEIAALAVAGDQERAAGLAFEHVTRFPEDAALLDRLTSPPFRSLAERRTVAGIGLPEKGAAMSRYLVVAHRTLGGDHLVDHLRSLREAGPSRFHLLVPVYHPNDHVWSEEEVTLEARRRLHAALERLQEHGIIADGEIGDANPVYAIGSVLRREGRDAFDGIVLSTLPAGPSRWLKLDVPTRVKKEYPEIPLTHLVGEPAPSTP
jgi:hypothetical protein